MKKLLTYILLTIFVIPITVFAEGYITAEPTYITVEQGSSTTFAIKAYNAIGDVRIISQNPGIASVSQGTWETGMVDEKVYKEGYITVSGNSAGTTTIVLTIDAATFDEEDLSGQVKTINVTVNPKVTPPPNNNDNNNNNNNNNNSKPVDTKSKTIRSIRFPIREPRQ